MDAKQGNDEESLSVNCLGLDVDPTLIERANKKTFSEDDIQAKFQDCNLFNANDHKSKCPSFLSLNGTSDFHRFDLTTKLSTTMWIHIHAGDDGLQAFL